METGKTKSALETVGVFKSFRKIAGATLAGLMAERQEKINRVLDGLAELPAHPDVQPAPDVRGGAMDQTAETVKGNAVLPR